MGTIRTPSTPAADAARAMRATPVRRGRMLGSSCVVPSGNTATTLCCPRGPAPPPRRWPCCRWRRRRRHAAARARRRRSRAACGPVPPTTGWPWPGTGATARARATSSTGSTNPLRWLAARITRPPDGGRPPPRPSGRRRGRAAPRRTRSTRSAPARSACAGAVTSTTVTPARRPAIMCPSSSRSVSVPGAISTRAAGVEGGCSSAVSCSMTPGGSSQAIIVDTGVSIVSSSPSSSQELPAALLQPGRSGRGRRPRRT